MEADRPGLSGKRSTDLEKEDTHELVSVNASSRTHTLELEPVETINTLETQTPQKVETIEKIDTIETKSIVEVEFTSVEMLDTNKVSSVIQESHIDTIDTHRVISVRAKGLIEKVNTLKIASMPLTVEKGQRNPVSTARGRALLLIALLVVLVIHATNMGSAQFIGAQGWAIVLGGSSTSSTNVLKNIQDQLTKATPGATSQPKQKLTPQQYINLIVQNMTLDQKLGQLMIVQFTGAQYSFDLDAMIKQYNVGAVLIFSANGNIVDKTQLKDLISQMQQNVALPLAIAIDQEGGTVDRLKALDGPRPSATSIGETNDPSKALAEGIQDATDLSSYGINLNLAPVVDVNNVYNQQLYLRTFGNDAATVTKFAGAYLQGLQQSGKVLGTLKHFPGLGDVAGDPHITVPQLIRPLNELEAIDWAPYRNLIAQGDVYSIMVTHEIVTALDTTKPSSLSSKVVTGILRDELGFQGVIMTDSLTMDGITAYYTEAQAAAVAIEAGDDLLMGASTPSTVAAMIEGIKQAMNSGDISQQRIDDSVRRILMMKYQMGLLPIPNN